MTTQKRDYYDVLGVGSNAGPDDIKRAYRKLAMTYHPDRNQGDADAATRFKEASEAYEVLSDPAKRQRYDQFGHAGISGSGLHDFTHMDVEDIFSMFGFGDLFGGGRRRGRGADLQTTVEITLNEVATAAKRTITFQRSDLCETCGGSGAAPGTTMRTCPTCGGYGQVEQTGGLGALFGRVITTCPSCRGRGQNVVTPCSACRGSGRTARERMVEVSIPPGIFDGQAVRVRGEGELGQDGRARGDLHCYVTVKSHPFLERDGNNLICRMPITFTQAALGATIEAPTLDGKADVRIPRGTKSGQLFRLAGRGLPDLRSGRCGHLFVQTNVEIPSKLTRKQEELLREYAKTEGSTIAPESRRFLDRLIKYFAGEDIG